MEENNYSTHEELQATLQELTDLQHQLEELQSENRFLSSWTRSEKFCRTSIVRHILSYRTPPE
jgi:cell shape-determining protein MreC